MEYIIFLGTFVLLMLLLAIKGMWDTKKAEKLFVKNLHDTYGSIPQKEYKTERFERIPGFYYAHRHKGQLDDITWNDLNMDEIFKRLNYTFSAAGEEYLYYTLRSPKMKEEELQYFENIVSYFSVEEEKRITIQLLAHKLGYTGKFSLYDYLNYIGTLGKRSNLKHMLLDLAFIPSILFCFVNISLGLFLIAVLMIYNIVTYFQEKKVIEPYMSSFAYIIRLLSISEKIAKLKLPPCEDNLILMREHNKRLSRMKGFSSWGISKAVMSGGNPLDILIDYIRMTFHVDLMMFNNMFAELQKHIEDVEVITEQIGYIETAIAIGSFRKSLELPYCIPTFIKREEGQQKGHICVKNAYHPLIQNPVTNSIKADKGVLLTGSNASGKSTFLKTIALEAVLAQTINTCMAEEYTAQFFHIYSSMSLHDSIESGESYYIVEIKALKRIIDVAQNKENNVLCFVDEVLRGTNTVERIAASTQILLSFSHENLCCFAATHDIELTSLLEAKYDNYHFEEEIRDGDIYFNYQLLDGKATTRNAIKLLEIMGYEEDIIEKARIQAEAFIEKGKWELA
ncbi:hypothetical protein LJC58_07830 [Lachnospiraceae bacterium OttesenSCG-928-D06]|nr:hypothetical protein [Lachnospiraceae bacterium OttesenSCG-928-D06]